jgi:hypothetical protein
MFDGDGNGGGNGHERVTMELEALVDKLELTYDRRDGSLKVGGRVINLDVALEICRRGASFFETQLRVQAAQQVQQRQAEQARVAALLDRTRGGRV